MQIELSNVRCRVVSCTERELAFLRKYLTFERETRGAFGARKVTVASLFRLADSSFPAGFLPLIRKAAEGGGFPLEVSDIRKRPCEPLGGARTDYLRDYQAGALERVLGRSSASGGPLERGIIQAATGAGKTEVFTALTQVLPCRWLIVVPGNDLLGQAVARIKLRTGQEPGACGDGIWNARRVTVATYQTLHARRGTIEGRQLLALTEGLVCDESHGCGEGVVYDIAQACVNAYWRFGFSATPLARGDRKSLFAVGAFGPVIYKISAQSLIERGFLSKPTIRVCSFRHDPMALVGMEYDELYNAAIVRNAARNAVVLDVCLNRAQRPGFVFVERVEHGRELTRLLTRAKLNVAFRWGAFSSETRKDAIQKLRRGELDFVVCNRIFNQGVDVPELKSCVNAASGKSTIQTLQRLGRGSRVTETKTTFEMWDFSDQGHRWLEEHSRARVRAYEKESYAIETFTPSTEGALL